MIEWQPIETAPDDRPFALRARHKRTGDIAVQVKVCRRAELEMGPDYIIEWAEVARAKQP